MTDDVKKVDGAGEKKGGMVRKGGYQPTNEGYKPTGHGQVITEQTPSAPTPPAGGTGESSGEAPAKKP